MPVPSVVLPSMKVTVPVAVDGDTLAVSVVFCPAATEVKLLVSVVVVVLGLTVCASAADVLVASLPSPL